MFSLQTNIASLTAQNNLTSTQMQLQKAETQLSSGLRINSSADDASGLAIANRDQLDDTDLQVGIQNGNTAVNNLQTIDGSMSNITSLLDRAMTLASQSASNTFTGSRTSLNSEFQSVLNEITREAAAAGVGTASTGTTNGANLASQKVFIGNTQSNTSSSVSYLTVDVAQAVDAQGLGLTTSTTGTTNIDISSASDAQAAVTSIQTAIGTLGTAQATVGSSMDTLQYAVSQAQTMDTNVVASESSIRDANIAQSAANMTKFNILDQSGIAALSQANQTPGNILKLLS